MLIGIDGTGTEVMPNATIFVDDPVAYQNAMKDSFVHQLIRDYKCRGKGSIFGVLH